MKGYRILIIGLAAGAIILAAGLTYYLLSENLYWAVYMRTGEIYFGKLSSWPRLTLTDVYLLQLTGDEKSPYSISRFDRSVWGPEDKIYLSAENVIWRARISTSSQLLDFFRNPQSFQRQLPAGGSSGVSPTE